MKATQWKADESRSHSVAALEPVHDMRNMHGRALLNNGVDHGDPHGAAKIPHQIE